MLNKEKIGLVADYLGFRFPMCTIKILDDMPCGPGYRIDRHGRSDQFFISQEFLDDCAKEILLPALEQLDLYDLFSLARGRNVLLGSKGIVFQEDQSPQKHESAEPMLVP